MEKKRIKIILEIDVESDNLNEDEIMEEFFPDFYGEGIYAVNFSVLDYAVVKEEL